jgi:hypothetical protein
MCLVRGVEDLRKRLLGAGKCHAEGLLEKEFWCRRSGFEIQDLSVAEACDPDTSTIFMNISAWQEIGQFFGRGHSAAPGFSCNFAQALLLAANYQIGRSLHPPAKGRVNAFQES